MATSLRKTVGIALAKYADVGSSRLERFVHDDVLEAGCVASRRHVRRLMERMERKAPVSGITPVRQDASCAYCGRWISPAQEATGLCSICGPVDEDGTYEEGDWSASRRFEEALRGEA